MAEKFDEGHHAITILEIEIVPKGGLKPRYDAILAKHPKLDRGNHANHLGTLGTGNHFIEVCLDESAVVWFMLHSGSRGVGNRMGTYFIELAKKDMERFFVTLPDRDLAYFPEHTEHFDDYVEAVEWAQDFARSNRDLMMHQIVSAVRGSGLVPEFTAEVKSINCHHNYVARESHVGQNVLVTRKGAVRAREGDIGIIPAAWVRALTSCAARVTRRASTAAVTAQVVQCLVMKRKSASRSRTTSV